MTSASDINLIPQPSINVEVKRRSTFNTSLILGIILLAVFLGFFVLEFSRILTLAGNVDHAPADLRRNESASSWHRAW